MRVEVKARANPAIDASTLGVTRHAKPVAPVIPAESKLNRTAIQKLTRVQISKSRIARYKDDSLAHIQEKELMFFYDVELVAQ